MPDDEIIKQVAEFRGDFRIQQLQNPVLFAVLARKILELEREIQLIKEPCS